jgi:hypothetical protein
MSAINQHGDMVVISAHLKLEADLKDQIYDLEHENSGLRVELEQQAICNGAGASRELALRSTITELQRENAALREQIDDWENAVLHARDNRSEEQHCTCVTPLIGKVKQLERKNAALRADKERLDWLDTNCVFIAVEGPCDKRLINARHTLDAARKEQP